MTRKARIRRYLQAIRSNISDQDTIETLLVNFENGAYERAARFVEKNAVAGPFASTRVPPEIVKAKNPSYRRAELANGIRRLKKEKTF